MARHLIFKSPTGETVQVKLGFSWQAFFVGSLKALLRRTWLLLVLAAIGYFMVAWTGGANPTLSSSRNIALLLMLLGIYVCYMLFCGIYGNRLLVSSLLRRGFRQVGDERR